jgi:transcriptional regulator with PAS, ATPase and Fis domain
MTSLAADTESKERRDRLAAWLDEVGAVQAVTSLADSLQSTAVFVVDSRRTILYWSKGAEELLGLSLDEVWGQHCLKVSRCEDCIRSCGIAQHGQITDHPLTIFGSNDQTIPVRKSGRAFYDHRGEFAGGIEVLVPDPEPRACPAPALGDDEQVTFHGLITRDRAMSDVFQIIRNVAETEASVLIRGESGSGKELVARALHQESPRRDGPFVAVNCAALAPTLLESELFGHVKGAFTGAVKDRIGLFQQANGGVLFLDEVAELPLDVQAKLLRVLEERVVVPVGATKAAQVDVRWVAATNKSLRSEAAAGRFRSDLLYRLRVVPIFLPPLRQRKTDIETLLWHMIEQRNRTCSRQVSSVNPAVMRALLDHDWPGNVRELRNVVDYIFAVGRGPEIRLEELSRDLRRSPQPAAKSQTRADEFEEQEIREALHHAGGHIGRAAQALGVSRPTLWRKRKKYQI